MQQIVESREKVDVASSFREQYLRAFRLMLLSRVLDEKMASLYRGGKIHGGVFLGRGQEALSVSVGLALRKGDVFAPADPRRRRTAGLWRTGFGCRAHLPRVTLWGRCAGATAMSTGDGPAKECCP